MIYNLSSWIMWVVPPQSPFQRPKQRSHWKNPTRFPSNPIHPSLRTCGSTFASSKTQPRLGWFFGTRWSGRRYQRMAQKKSGNMSKTPAVCLFFKAQPQLLHHPPNSQGWGWVTLCRQMFGFGSFCTTAFSRVEQESNGIGIEIGRYPRTASAWQHPLIFI